MRFNSDVSRDRLTEISRVINAALKRDSKPSAEAAVAYFDELCRDIKIPRKLTEAGAKPDQLSALVEQAVHDGCYASNPKAVTRADFERLYREAF